MQQTMLQNKKIKKKIVFATVFDKPTNSESQTDFNKGADDISINANAEMPVDNHAGESQEIYCREHH